MFGGEEDVEEEKMLGRGRCWGVEDVGEGKISGSGGNFGELR